MNFTDYLWGLLPRPLRLKQGENRKTVEAVGLILDALKKSIFAIRRAWLIRKAPESALTLLGEGLSMPRQSWETAEGYRERLAAAFDWFYWQGTRRGIQKAVAFATNVNCKVLEYPAENWRMNKSRLGCDTRLFSTKMLYVFNVIFERELSAEEEKKVREVIDLVKPAHTRCYLRYPEAGRQAFWRLNQSRLRTDTRLSRQVQVIR